jgi:hypothetical protein
MMVADLDMERLYGRIRLVRGKGDRNSDALCIMTFVALLAGERHTDAPSTASPLVRQFAIALNDAMPDLERQRLKPFAPRVIGSADGFDPGRAAVLRQAMQREVFPSIRCDLEESVLPLGPLHDPYGTATAHPAAELLCGFTAVAAAEDTPRNQRKLALLAARLLSACAAAASGATAREWYWAKAIDLLDRMCDVGMPRKVPELDATRVEKLLSRKASTSWGGQRMAETLQWLGHTLGAWVGSASATGKALAPTAATRLPTTTGAPEHIVMPRA